jgi:hypothetical protein
MKASGRILWIMGGSFLTVDLVYLVWSLRAHNLEIVGLIAIGLSGLLCVLLAFYFGRVVAGTPELLAEDQPNAEIDSGDPEIGFFSPWSWWPVLLAFSANLMMVGLAISPWIAIIATPFLFLCIVGLIFQYYRGSFAR